MHRSKGGPPFVRGACCVPPQQQKHMGLPLPTRCLHSIAPPGDHWMRCCSLYARKSPPAPRSQPVARLAPIGARPMQQQEHQGLPGSMLVPLQLHRAAEEAGLLDYAVHTASGAVYLLCSGQGAGAGSRACRGLAGMTSAAAAARRRCRKTAGRLPVAPSLPPPSSLINRPRGHRPAHPGHAGPADALL